jgi:hypothetical protein
MMRAEIGVIDRIGPLLTHPRGDYAEAPHV